MAAVSAIRRIISWDHRSKRNRREAFLVENAAVRCVAPVVAYGDAPPDGRARHHNIFSILASLRPLKLAVCSGDCKTSSITVPVVNSQGLKDSARRIISFGALEIALEDADMNEGEIR